MERTEVTYLDTCVVVWLFGGETDKLSKAAAAGIREAEEILVSPAVVLELQLLHDIKRARTAAMKVVERLSAEIGLAICRLPFASVVEHALDQAWTRDPFDRLIVAHARANDASLITRDERIRRHYRRSIW
ncbi:MAG: type II toxin-antitoxin system VapC family toxin [Bryobacteraceae bacterium]